MRSSIGRLVTLGRECVAFRSERSTLHARELARHGCLQTLGQIGVGQIQRAAASSRSRRDTCDEDDGELTVDVTLSEEGLEALTALAGVALTQSNLEAALVEICRIAARSVPRAEGASITTFPQGRPGALGDSEWARTLDELQYAEHEGPCLDAFRTGNAFRIRDLAAEPRWPSYVPRAVRQGARSMMSMPLSAEGKVIGALNVYSKTPDAFDTEAASVADILAAHAGLACQVSTAYFGHRTLAEQLSEALQSRAVIEQAKGIIMATDGCDAEVAFKMLVRQSQSSQKKLRAVAAEIVERVSRPT
ncbi:MAG TPA: GAF and ANTAR domain-containing protein [Mycobacteriales bacterium]|nr:GAF and ANTAR domain-containing protein [Mycobacteriales bacterium]